jgi:chromatin modification-related protein YNG2
MPPPPAPSRPSLSARSSGTSYHPQNRSSSRADRHKSVSTVSDVDLDADVDVDAEGEIELGETDGDDTIYCTCQNKSYGEMIGCDNDNCEFEWVSLRPSHSTLSCPVFGGRTDVVQFHIKCVGVTPPLPETWYCPDCIKKQGARERKTKKR